MKAIALLIGLGLLTMVCTTACEEEGHEHHGYGGAYDGYYQGYGHGEYGGYPDYNGHWHHD